MDPLPWIGGEAWPAVDGTRMVEKAQGWLGTPWAHDQRCKGAGVDCTGLIVGVFEECGIPVQDQRGYTRGDEYGAMIDAIEAHCDLVDGEWWPGDLLVFRNLRLPPPLTITNHVAFYAGPASHEMIHAWATPSINRVCQHPIDAFWAGCVVAVYRYRGAVWHP